MSIVTRSTSGYNVVAKGSGLTNTEADNNIYELLSDPSYPGVDMAALHRSPNAVTAMFVYDTSKDSDGGAWTEKCQHTSWYNEPLMGKWLGAQDNEINARYEFSTVGAELISNGSFASGTTGWAITLANVDTSNGYALITPTSHLTRMGISQSFATVVGKTYKLTYRVVSGGGSNTHLYIGTSYASNVNGNGSTSVGNRTVIFTATAATTYISIGIWASTETIAVDDISIKEVTALNTASGDYFQLTTDGKFYRMWKNLLPRSNEFGNAAWSKTACSVGIAAIAAPDGTMTAYKLIADNTLAYHVLSRYSPVAATTHTASIYVKPADGANYVQFELRNASTSSRVIVEFNTSTLAMTPNIIGSPTNTSYSIESVGNGWFRLRVSAQLGNDTLYGIALSTYNSSGSNHYVGDGTSGTYVWGAQLEVGSTATTYEAKTADGSTTEVFRGNKAKFPKLAGVVAEAGNVNIYDLTEPGRPMWMRFVTAGADIGSTGALGRTGANKNALSCLNSVLTVGSASTYAEGLQIISFAKETVINYSITSGVNYSYLWNGNLSQRNTNRSWLNINIPNIVSQTVNAVAMTVLPDAPLDPVTGLAVPTIAVATGGGVSVIKHNGTVVNSSSTASYSSAQITKDVMFAQRTGNGFDIALTPGLLGASFAFSQLNSADPLDFARSNSARIAIASSTSVARVPNSGTTSAFALLKNNAGARLKGISSQITNTYNTGHMIGDIRRAYLADNTVESVSGPELVTNGTFDTDTTGWSIGYGGSLSTFTASGGVATLTAVSGDSSPRYKTTVSGLTVGKRYALSMTNAGSTGSGDKYLIWTSVADGTGGSSFLYPSSGTRYVVATASTMFVALNINNPSAGATFSVDNISVKEAVADRSYKASGATINGTLTKSQVATGTSLVAYSGFSAANYLREPYSADLDMGVGEWSVGAWVNVPATLPAANFPIKGSNLTTNGYFNADISGWAQVTTTPLEDKIIWNDNGTVTLTKGPNNGYSFVSQTIGSNYLAGTVVKLKIVVTAITGYLNYVNIVGYGPYEAFGFSAITATGTYEFTYTTTQNRTNGLAFNVGFSGPSNSSATIDSIEVFSSEPVRIMSREFSSGSNINLGVNSNGTLTATAYDGTTTRTVTTTAAYNTGTWCKAEAVYKTDGSLAILVNGNEVAVTRGNPLLTLDSRYNLLTYTEQFDNAAWTKFRANVTPNAIVAPDGTTTADKLIATSASGSHGLVQAAGTLAVAASVCLKAAEYSYVAIGFNNATPSTTTDSVFNLSNGTLASSGSDVSSYSITDLGSGWYRIKVISSGTANTSQLRVSVMSDSTTISFVGNDTSGIYIWGADLRRSELAALPYQRVNTATDFDLAAPLTIGNSYALDAPFPGSIALLKLSATAPTYDQALWMYEQEKQLFRDGAQCVLPDANSIVDLTYDSQTDRWKAISSTNESYWSGLVRTKVEPVPAGSYTKLAANSGIHLVARSTTNPGVDITIPKINIKEEYKRKAESAQKTQKNLVVFDFDTISFTATTTNGSKVLTSVASVTGTPYRDMGLSGTGVAVGTTLVGTDSTTYYISAAATASNTGVTMTQTDYRLPVGYTASLVFLGGVQKIEGATKDFIRLFDGFRETIRFNAAPSSGSWIQIHAYVDQS